MKKPSRRRNIVNTAIYSRMLVLFLQYVFNYLITDHKADAFLYPKENTSRSSGDEIVEHLMGGFLRWDAQYFMHIAKYGYTYENMVAFFPLYPLLAALLAKVSCLQDILSVDSILLVIFILLNFICFVYSALTLYELGQKLLPEKLAYYSALLFCWNPASVFFTAPYTECLFSYLSFKSMLNCILLYEKYSNLRGRIVIGDILFLCPIALSGVTRSNGILNIGFILYALACIFLKNFMKIEGNILKRLIKRISLILAFTIITLFCIIFCIFPFDLFQIYCYKLFCTDFMSNIPYHVETFGIENNLVMFGKFSKYNQSWCNDKLPLAYSYVQNKYWNVGFLKYYQLKQIPNFLLAAPILGIFFFNCREHLIKNWPKTFLQIFNFNTVHVKANLIFENPLLFVYVIHGLFLSIFCLFFIHIQVSTRFLCSASPLLYWFSAYHLIDNGKFCDLRNFKGFPFRRKFIILYFFTYYIVGILLFCNYLPWT